MFRYNSFQYNPKVVELLKNCDHFKDSFRVNKKNFWFEYSPFFKLRKNTLFYNFFPRMPS